MLLDMLIKHFTEIWFENCSLIWYSDNIILADFRVKKPHLFLLSLLRKIKGIFQFLFHGAKIKALKSVKSTKKELYGRGWDAIY